MSITNAAEHLATEIYKNFLKEKGWKMDDVRWAESYPYLKKPTYDAVEYEIDNGRYKNPKWSYINDLNSWIKRRSFEF